MIAVFVKGKQRRKLSCTLQSLHLHSTSFSQFLTLILLMWRIWWAPNNASRWQMGFSSAFKGLNSNQWFPFSTLQFCQLIPNTHRTQLKACTKENAFLSTGNMHFVCLSTRFILPRLNACYRWDKCYDFRLSPCFEYCMYSFGYFPGVRL